MLAVGGTSCISLVSVAAADENSLTPLHRLLPTETASLGFGGSPVGDGDKNFHFTFFRHFHVWGWYHYPRAAVAVSEQPRAGFISAEKRLSQSGCSVPTNALFPPAHSAFSAFLHGGGITTLGVRFMPLKHWTRRSYGGVFAVFMPSRNLPRAGRISPRRVHTPPQPLTAHTAAHTPKHGGFSGSMVTMFPVAGSSTPSTLFRQIRRSPLLLRKDTVMPFLLRASTLLRIR